MTGHQEIQNLLGGINPFKEIPGLWFELFKTQYFLQCVLDGKGPYDQENILKNSCEFAMGEVRKRFPKLDCTLTKNQMPDEKKETTE